MSIRNKNIRLSVICLTYNHKKFIRQALDGFVMQKTNFPFEVIVHDDASTDGTQDIIKEYQKKFPQIIKPIFQKVNQFSQEKNIVMEYIIDKIQGKYVAINEGDDYWVDEYKLQKQVDFLDTHQDFSICFHPVEVIWEDGSQPNSIFPSKKERFNKSILELSDLLKRNFIQTNSVVYRWCIKKDEYPKKRFLPGDWFDHLLHAQNGKIGFLNDVMSVYRKHSESIWWKAGQTEDFFVKNGILLMRFYQEVENYFNVDRKKAIGDVGRQTLFSLLNQKQWKKIEEFSNEFPILWKCLSSRQYQETMKKERQSLKRKKQILQAIIVLMSIVIIAFLMKEGL